MSILVFVFTTTGYSQEMITEEIAMTNGEIKIPGTLSYPKSEERLPLVIFVHGSGNINRNGNQEPIIKANYIKQLADSLNTNGIAFYRYDKRSSIKENLPLLKGILFNDLVDDVQLAIESFAKDPRFSGIHLIGHSQGSLVAMLATNNKVKSYTSLAGPGESISKIIVKQLQKQNDDLAKAAETHLVELMETDTIQEVNPFLMQLFAPQNQKFIKSWMVYNPVDEIKKVKKPIFILHGSADLQITEDDASKLASAVSLVNASFKPSTHLLVIENMNHVLKTVANMTENQASYYDPDFPLSSELIDALVNFIRQNG